jgi:hypothetical protein
MEYDTVSAYEGVPPSGSNPVLAQLIRNLAPGETPIVRIGGDSTDWTWWPIPGVAPPLGVKTDLSSTWVAQAQALAQSAGARLILGVNLEADSTAIAAVEAQELIDGIGSQYVDALEIGNEPQLYPKRPWYLLNGVPQFGRPTSYDLADYTAEFQRIAKVMPSVALAGPSVGHSWVTQLPEFIPALPAGGMVTFHAYGIDRFGGAFRGRNCSTPPGDPTHATVAALLAPFASLGLTRELAPSVALAHSRGLTLRVDELNAITCAGTPGVSDTFASALWALDTMFGMAQAGVDGVNVHTWRGSAGKLFGFTDTAGQWSATVRPEYYGLLMFAQAAPTGSTLLRTTEVNGTGVQSWAVLAPDHSVRVVLINDSMTESRPVLVSAPRNAGPATLERLLAPSAGATSGVTLGCQSFAAQTTTGVLAGTPCTTTVRDPGGVYSVTLPAASAAMLTIPAQP